MPAGKGQSNATLYALITFVALFLISTVAAVMFYLNWEDLKTANKEAIKDKNDLVSSSDFRQLGSIIGEKVNGEPRITTLMNYYNEIYTMVTGQLPQEDMSAQTKLEEIKEMLTSALSQADQQALGNIPTSSPNLIGTIATLSVYSSEQRDIANDLSNEVTDLIDRLAINEEDSEEYAQRLQAEKDDLQRMVDQIQNSYDGIRDDLDAKIEEQVLSLQNKLDEKNADIYETNQKLLQLQASYDETDTTRKRLELQLEGIKPKPNIEVEAFKADARVISADLLTGLVYIDIGSLDKVYKGLTFAVYDKSAPIPADGKGKADIEVFELNDHVAVARIVKNDIKNPIIPDDVVVNLIWNKNTPNVFVISGDFDFDSDGNIDRDGVEKVERLVHMWGGRVTDKVNINTDFVVLGEAPFVPSKPNTDQMDFDPILLEKYEKAIQDREEYNNIKDLAGNLSIPVFDTKRFKNLIGYETRAKNSKPY